MSCQIVSAAAFGMRMRRRISNTDAIAQMNSDAAYALPWTESTAYRVLGPRGAFAGRRRPNG